MKVKKAVSGGGPLSRAGAEIYQRETDMHAKKNGEALKTSAQQIYFAKQRPLVHACDAMPPNSMLYDGVFIPETVVLKT